MMSPWSSHLVADKVNNISRVAEVQSPVKLKVGQSSDRHNQQTVTIAACSLQLALPGRSL